MDKQNEAKLNWWVDIGLLLFSPVVTLLTALLDSSEAALVFTTFYLPVPVAVALGIRLTRRIKAHPALILVCGFSLIVFSYCIVIAVSMFGCALGGGTRHFF